jgi:CBS domain-containing protein
MTMQVRDVMTRKVISVTDDDSILAAARLMLQNRISGLPVLDAGGNLVGVVTEGDFLRRGEIGTQRARPAWLEFLLGAGRLADEYVHAFGRKVSEIMTADPICVTEDDSLRTVVELMERGRVKRLPVIRDGRLIGIVSRANLVRTVVGLARDTQTPSADDTAIQNRVIEAIGKQSWGHQVKVTVKDGVVDLSGVILNDHERTASIVAAENVAGVKGVHDHLVWVEPMSGMAFPSSEDQERQSESAVVK